MKFFKKQLLPVMVTCFFLVGSVSYASERVQRIEPMSEKRKQFLLACRNGDIDKYLELRSYVCCRCEDGSDWQDVSGWPLFEAIYGNHIAIVKLLVKDRADLNFCVKGMDALSYAAFLGRREIIAWLLINVSHHGIEKRYFFDWLKYVGKDSCFSVRAQRKMVQWLLGVRGAPKEGCLPNWCFDDLCKGSYFTKKYGFEIYKRQRDLIHKLDSYIQKGLYKKSKNCCEKIKKLFDCFDTYTMRAKQLMLEKLFKIYHRYTCYDMGYSPISDEDMIYFLSRIMFNERFFRVTYNVIKNFIIKYGVKDVLGQSLLEAAIRYCPGGYKGKVISEILYESGMYKKRFFFKEYVKESRNKSTTKDVFGSIVFGLKNGSRWLRKEKVSDYEKAKNEYISALHLAKKLWEPKAFKLLANDSLVNDDLYEFLPKEIVLLILEFAGPRKVNRNTLERSLINKQKESSDCILL